MKVRELTVTNFRGFAGERRFQLSERFTVIAGINGRGKSSLLDGLALLLARLSIWWAAFTGDADMRRRLRQAFTGTCPNSFDASENLHSRPGGQL